MLKSIIDKFWSIIDTGLAKSHDTSQLYHAHSCDIIVINTAGADPEFSEGGSEYGVDLEGRG